MVAIIAYYCLIMGLNNFKKCDNRIVKTWTEYCCSLENEKLGE